MAQGAEAAPADSPPTYAITVGGPLRRIERLLHVTGIEPRRYDWLRRTGLFLLIGYVPLVLLGLGWRLLTGDWLPALARIESHVRALVTVPLLLFAEPLIEARARDAGRYLLASQMATQTQEACRRAVQRTAALRDSTLIEAGLFALAIASAVVDPAAYYGVGTVALSLWGSLPLVVLLRFLLLRWMWRWLLWAIYLHRLARVPLALHATHPDRFGGLAPFLGPSHEFWAISAAVAASLSGAWAELMLYGQASLAGFRTPAIALVALAVVVALMPVLVFMPRLYNVRWAGITDYGAFAHRYTGAFEQRWLQAPGVKALGTPDLQSLADLGGGYEAVDQIHVLAWSRRIVQSVVVASLLPMLPLVLLEIGFTELVSTLVERIA